MLTTLVGKPCSCRSCCAYLDGDGVPRDDTLAVRWCTSAAEQGHPEASLTPGNLSAQGRGVEQDGREAQRWYGSVAESSVAEALARLRFTYAKCHRWIGQCGRCRSMTVAGGNTAPVWTEELTEVTDVRDDVRARLMPEELADAVRLVMASRSAHT